MAVDKGLMGRIMGVVNSASLRVFPVGMADEVDRGILRVRELGRLQDVVKLTFAAVVLSSALAMPGVSHAGGGVGYDASVYGQQQGQVMQAGSAIRMTVVGVRPVKIEVAGSGQGNQMIGYAATAAAGGLGAVVGSHLGGNSQAGQQVGGILGALAGAIGGAVANNMMNSPQQVSGTEITMVNPANNQLSVITQAGDVGFSRGDRVLVMSVGGNTRVVADTSPAVQQDVGAGQRQVDRGELRSGGYQSQGRAVGSAGMVSDIVHSASMMGIRVDPGKVADVLEKGNPDHGMSIGKVVGVDRENGFVYQSTGRGTGVVFDMSSLSRVPAVGEVATVRFKDGQGFVAPAALSRGHGRG